MPLTFRSVSSVASASSGDLTMNAPAGGAQGDLYVATISYRSNAAFTLPSGGEWTLVDEENSGNTTANSTGSIGSGLMAYCIRGSSEPNFVFTRTGGDIALGRVVAYTPGAGETVTLDQASGNTLGSASTTVTTTGVTTTEDLALVVMAECLARSTTASRARATDPDEFIWRERADSSTTTGADCGLAISDATKFAAGATGTLTYTAGSSARHVCIVGAFKTGYSGVRPKVVASGSKLFSSSNLSSSSFTPSADTLLVAVCVLAGEPASITSGLSVSVSGGSLTWTQIEDTHDDNAGVGVKIVSFWAVSGPSPSSMSVTVDPSGTPDHDATIYVFECPGADTSSPIGALVENSHITDTQSVTLSAAPDATSFVLQALTSVDDTGPTSRHVLAADDCLEIVDATPASSFATLGVQIRFGNTSTSIAWADAMEGATVAAADITPTHAFEILAASGETTAAPPLLGATSVLYAPSAAPLFAVTAPLLSSASALHAPSIVRTMQPPLLASASALYEPTVVPVFSETAPLLASTGVLHAPAATVVLGITAPLLGSASALYEPTVAESRTVAPPLLASTSALHAPAVDAQIALTAPHLSSGASLYAPTVDLTVTAPHLGSASQLHAPTATPVLTAGAPLLTSVSQLYAPTVSVTLSITAPLLGSASALYAPTTATLFTAAPARLESASALYEPTVSAGGDNVAAPPLLGSTSVLYAPTVSVTLDLTAPLLGSVSALYGPTTSLTLFAPLKSSDGVIYGPATALSVNAPLLTSASALYAPVTSLSLFAPMLGASSALHAPSAELVLGIDAPHLASVAVLYAPSITTSQEGDFTAGERVFVAAPREVWTAAARLRTFTAPAREPFVAEPRDRTFVSDTNEDL